MADTSVIPSDWIKGARFRDIYQFAGKMQELKLSNPGKTAQDRLQMLISQAGSESEQQKLKATFRLLKSVGLEDCRKEDIKQQLELLSPTALKDVQEKEAAKKSADAEIEKKKEWLSECRKQSSKGHAMRFFTVLLATLAVAGFFFALPTIAGTVLSSIGGAASMGAAVGTGVIFGVGGYYAFKAGSSLFWHFFDKANGLINEAKAEKAKAKKELKGLIKDGVEKDHAFSNALEAYDALESDLNEMTITDADREAAKTAYTGFEKERASSDKADAIFKKAQNKYFERLADAQTVGDIKKAKELFEKDIDTVPTNSEIECAKEMYGEIDERIKTLKRSRSYSKADKEAAIKMLESQKKEIESNFKKGEKGAVLFEYSPNFSRNSINGISGYANIQAAEPEKRGEIIKDEVSGIYGSVATKKELQDYIKKQCKNTFAISSKELDGETGIINKFIQDLNSSKKPLSVVRDEKGKIKSCNLLDFSIDKKTYSIPSKSDVANFIIKNPRETAARNTPGYAFESVGGCKSAVKYLIENATEDDAVTCKYFTVPSHSKKYKQPQDLNNQAGKMLNNSDQKNDVILPGVVAQYSINERLKKSIFGGNAIQEQSKIPYFVLESELRSKYVPKSSKTAEEFEDVIAEAIKKSDGKAVGSVEFKKVLKDAEKNLANVAEPISEKTKKSFATVLQGKGLGKFRGLFDENGNVKQGLTPEHDYAAKSMQAAYISESKNMQEEKIVQLIIERTSGIKEPTAQQIREYEWKDADRAPEQVEYEALRTGRKVKKSELESQMKDQNIKSERDEYNVAKKISKQINKVIGKGIPTKASEKVEKPDEKEK